MSTALKEARVSGISNLHLVPDDLAASTTTTLFSPSCSIGGGGGGEGENFVVVGHRGSGMNVVQSADPRMRAFKENSILSFNAAALSNIHFVEFDVQVTKDDSAVIFHDNFILTEDEGTIVEKRVTDLTVEEFLSYGPQGEFRKVGKPLFRRTREGRLLEWKVETDDPLCTLEEAFQKTDQSLGFDIELKFDDYVIYEEDQLRNILEVILKVVKEYAKERPIMFSSFQPDAAELIRKMQDTYPVYFITKGGSEIYVDPRRNTLDEAIKLCMAAGLQGIVSEAKAIFKNPEVVALIKESKLFLMTYGQLNNVPDAVYMQYLMGVEGVVVDLVKEIKGAVLDFTKAKKESDDTLFEGKGTKEEKGKLCFSEHEPSFWLKPIP